MDSSVREEGLDRTGKWPTILGSNVLYLVVLLMMIGLSVVFGTGNVGEVDTDQWLEKAFIMELLVIGIPPLLYLLISRMKIKEVIRLNKLGAIELLLVLGMAVFGYGIVAFVNMAWYWVISHIGTPIVPELPPLYTGRQYLMAILVMALTPAVVEEFFFRGVVLRGYERFGPVVAMVVTGMLFGFLHLSLANIPAIIFLGIMITYVVQRTNSIFSGVIYHFVQNTISISLLFLQGAAEKYLQNGSAVIGDINQVSPQMLAAAMVIWGIIGLFCLGLFILCVISFHRVTRNKASTRQLMSQEMRPLSIKEMLPIIGAGVIVVILLGMEVFTMAMNLQ
jgi:membrane protease YdiL (CAAX protease family)